MNRDVYPEATEAQIASVNSSYELWETVCRDRRLKSDCQHPIICATSKKSRVVPRDYNSPRYRRTLLSLVYFCPKRDKRGSGPMFTHPQDQYQNTSFVYLC